LTPPRDDAYTARTVTMTALRVLSLELIRLALPGLPGAPAV